MITPKELERRIALPLDEKIKWAKGVIAEFWCQYHENGEVYVAFSGGKDSQVLLHLVRSLFPDVPAVFADTGLEYPEIRKHVKTFDNVVWVKPAEKFPDVIRKYGVAVGTKKVAMMLERLSKPTDKNTVSHRLYLTGIKKDGTQSKGSFKLPGRWRKFIGSDVKVSGKCCDVFKKDPFRAYERRTARKPIVGTTTSEASMRKLGYLQTGCNTMEKGKEKSRPLSIWTEADIWAYAEINGFRFCELYYDRIVNGVMVKAEKRTGCMFCMFGVHLEPKSEPNRFQRMAASHPRQYRYCIEELGLGRVLRMIGVNPEPVPVQGELFN